MEKFHEQNVKKEININEFERFRLEQLAEKKKKIIQGRINYFSDKHYFIGFIGAF